MHLSLSLIHIFLAADYNADEALINPNVDLIIVTDEEGNVVSDNIIDTTTAGEYTVEYITYHDGVIGGTVVTTQKVYVRGITTVLEKIIANAEKLMENGALDNTDVYKRQYQRSDIWQPASPTVGFRNQHNSFRG